MCEGGNTWELGEQPWDLEISGKEYWRNLRNYLKNKLKHIGEHLWEHVIEACEPGGGNTWKLGEQYKEFTMW